MMPLVVCPECQCQISSQAITCPSCGFPMQPHASGSGPTAVNVFPNYHLSTLQEIAYRHKLLLYALLLYLLTQIPILVLLNSGSLALLAWLIILAEQVLAIWCVFKLGQALGLSLPGIWFAIAGTFIPVVVLIVFVTLSNGATQRLRDAGVRVGFMGAALNEVP